jgi:peroxiredoxin
MLRFRFLLLYLSLSIGTVLSPAAEIGSKVENFRLLDISGKEHTLHSHSGKILALVFWSYKCPVSLGYANRIEDLQNKYEGKPVTVLGIVTGSNEKAAEILANMANLKVTFPVLLDAEGELAMMLDATHTPGIFLIDRDGILRYRGALDNNKKIGDDKRTAYAENAIDAILNSRPIDIPETKAFGCSIRKQYF